MGSMKPFGASECHAKVGRLHHSRDCSQSSWEEHAKAIGPLCHLDAMPDSIERRLDMNSSCRPTCLACAIAAVCIFTNFHSHFFCYAVMTVRIDPWTIIG